MHVQDARICFSVLNISVIFDTSFSYKKIVIKLTSPVQDKQHQIFLEVNIINLFQTWTKSSFLIEDLIKNCNYSCTSHILRWPIWISEDVLCFGISLWRLGSARKKVSKLTQTKEQQPKVIWNCKSEQRTLWHTAFHALHKLMWFIRPKTHWKIIPWN